MPREVLHTWVSGAYVGRFERDFEVERPRFVYDSGSTERLSFSLPRDRGADRDAARNFLDAMLPESEVARSQIQALTGAVSGSTWDLLAAIGGDLPGGVVLSPSEDGPALEASFTSIARAEVVAARIAGIKHGGTGFEFRDGQKPRFSLAGAQPKFALARMPGVDFWPDSATPSTHILKPESNTHRGLELVEAATLELARRTGIDAALAEQATFGAETTLVLARFDRRVLGDGTVVRLHSEDMTQALGLPSSKKYLVDAAEIAGLLVSLSGTDELALEFYRQYAFNSFVGNADAHGKNYSLLYADGRTRLSPLYDAIPLAAYPYYDQSLAMPVGATNRYTAITPGDWVESAEAAQLSPDRVLAVVGEVARGMLEHIDATLGLVSAVPEKVRADIKRVAEKHLS